MNVTISSNSVNTNKVTTYHQPLFKTDSGQNNLNGYLSSEKFFEVLQMAYYSEYGEDDHLHHPEDLYVNVSSVLGVICNTLGALVDIERGRAIQDVRNKCCH